MNEWITVRWSRLQYAHAEFPILRKTTRNNAAGCSSANHHIVENLIGHRTQASRRQSRRKGTRLGGLFVLFPGFVEINTVRAKRAADSAFVHQPMYMR